MPTSTALLVGLTQVDPTAYHGWDGKNGCQGCALDVANLSRLLSARDWTVHTLLDEQATHDSVLGSLRKIQAAARPGDSVFFYFSGHGGQMTDLSGDEHDKKDETLICFDRPIIDDDLDKVWTSFLPGVEIFMLSDSCNSGTNYRLANDDFPIATPLLPLSDLKTQGEMQARMLHIGGCRDARTSTGLLEGGVFTTAIVEQIDGGFYGTWADLYELVRLTVSETQDPQLNLYPVNGNTLDRRAPFVSGPTGHTPAAAPISPVPPAGESTDAPGNPDFTDGATILGRIDRVIAARSAAEATGTRGGGIRLVAEGDSWFDFKIEPDVIDWLRKDYGYDIVNLAKAGGCVYEMAYGPDEDSLFDVFGRDPSELEEVVKKIRSHKPEAILLSGAGNDFVGPEFILTILHANAKKSGLNQGVMDAVMQNDLEPAFRGMIETILLAGRNAGLGTLPIFIHGYDHPFPDGRAAANFLIKKIGPWMLPSFLLKGYPNRGPQDLQARKAIVALAIDTVYRMLRRLAASYPSLHIVDVRGVLPQHGDWHDELHPTAKGFRKVAAKFHDAIRGTLGGGSRSASIPGLVSPDSSRASDTIRALSTENLETLLASRRQIAAIRALLAGNDLPAIVEAVEAASLRRADDLTASRALPSALAGADDLDWQQLEADLAVELGHAPAEDDLFARDAGLRAAPSYDQRRAHYAQLFDSCTIRAEKAGEIAWYRKRILAGRPRYEALASELGIPWAFIGIIHALECSCSFQKHLHNGDPLTARTVRVPRGRPAGGNPPFSFETSARDALTMPGKQFHLQTDWSVTAMIYRWEKYNGFGYLSKGIESPYLWSYSNHYSKGKYVTDGVFNPAAVSKQVGAAVLLKDLVAEGHYTPVNA